MLDKLALRPDDRLLLLWVPETETVERLSARLSNGLIVVIGLDDEIRAGRRSCSHLENVMFTPGTADEIPWRDALFTVAVVKGAPTPEVIRVVTPGGAIMRV
ncbi:MAG: hypothetical protein ABI693_05365 [Bryobacteraceae bacterium]